MAICGGCNQESLRVRADYIGSDLVREYCIKCKPKEFAEQPVTDPSDKKIYVGWEAMPEKYRIEDGVAHAKDELMQDTADLMNKTDEQVAIEHKRRTRRTEPMSPVEIKEAERWGREVLYPDLKRRHLNRMYGHT